MSIGTSEKGVAVGENDNHPSFTVHVLIAKRLVITDLSVFRNLLVKSSLFFIWCESRKFWINCLEACHTLASISKANDNSDLWIGDTGGKKECLIVQT
jgi:hypothetical protein